MLTIRIESILSWIVEERGARGWGDLWEGYMWIPKCTAVDENKSKRYSEELNTLQIKINKDIQKNI